MLTNAHKPVVGFAAWSGTGKTTLLTALIPLLRSQGRHVAMIKHAHHKFEVDKPGKDSYELRKAGAAQMLVASSRLEALMVEKEEEREPDLNRLLARLDQTVVDMILVEGFKQVVFPKVELYRPALGKPAMYPQDADIIAVATDGDLPELTELPVLDINDPAQIAEFLCSRFCDLKDHPDG